jgi:hypothetical protein
MSAILTMLEILSFATAAWYLLKIEERRHEMDIAEKPEGAAGEKPVAYGRCLAWTAAAFLAVWVAREMPWMVTATAVALGLVIWLRKAASRARLYRWAADVSDAASKLLGRRAEIATAAAEASAREEACATTEAECRADLLRAWLALH